MDWTDEAIIEHLRSRLDKDRFTHSLNVAQSARELAEIHGGDPAKCYTAGLLHDVTKQAEKDAHFALFARAGVTLTPEEANNPKLWHAMSGAIYMALEMGIDDPELQLAVRYHTTGRAGMTQIERIVYVADFVSAERKYDDVDVMRGLAAVSLDKAMLYALRYTITTLVKGGGIVHPDSLALYNELILKGWTL